MEIRAMRQVVKGLWSQGWSADEWFNGCEVPDNAIEDAFEAMVHELAHNVMVDLSELGKPKNPHGTSALARQSQDPNGDEVATTAITILVCKFFGSDMREVAYESMVGNLVAPLVGLSDQAQRKLALAKALKSPEIQHKSDQVLEYLLRSVQ